MFSVHTETALKPAFSNPSGLKSVFEKVHFPEGLVWTVGLAAVSIFPRDSVGGA